MVTKDTSRSSPHPLSARSALVAISAIVIFATLATPSSALTPKSAGGAAISMPASTPARTPLDTPSVLAPPKDKAPKDAPSRRPVRTPARSNTLAAASPPAAAATTPDTTPSSSPTAVVSSAQSITGMSASWSPALDAESGVSYYVFAIGTNPAGDTTTRGNTRWWQVTYSTSMNVNVALDPAVTYYVSVYAVNGAGLSSAFATSNPVQPVWRALGAPTNVMSLAFATNGYDAGGATAAGWTTTQISTMTAFYTRMYPILVALYGPPADNYTVTAVRDLAYTRSNIFIPSTDEIRMSDSFSAQLFTHELIHAFRNDHILSSDSNWAYDPTLSGFEEGFAQAVSYEAMNAYVAAYPTDSIVPGNTLWGSSNDSNYDVQNVPEIRGTDFWSDGGGAGLYWLRYEMAATAIRKINIESQGFYKAFNTEYYRRINTSPTTLRSTRAVIVDIIKTLVPQIEGTPAANWIDAQNIFYSQNVYGQKIFHKIQDYPTSQLYAFQSLYFMETMSCGSEWACWDGTKWVYHRLNGATGAARLLDAEGSVVWAGPLQITPTTNPADGYMGFGSAVKNLTTASTLLPWPGGNTADYVMNLSTLSLYTFETTFTDPLTNKSTTNSIKRVLGQPVTNSFGGVYGGVVGHRNGTIYLDHAGLPSEPGIPVAHGAFAGTRSWSGISNTRTGGRDSIPGRVSITFVDSDTGQTFSAKRNVDYGSATGSQMFLFDFPPLADTTPPAVSMTSPATAASISGSVAINASASDDVGVTRVEFSVDGSLIATDSAAPYGTTWNAEASPLGLHSITAKAFDAAGNSSVSTVTPRVVDATAPVVTFTAPLTGALLATGTKITLSATATDNRGVARVEFSVNGVLKATDKTSPYSWIWTVPSGKAITYTLRARAFDATGLFSDSIISVKSK